MLQILVGNLHLFNQCVNDTRNPIANTPLFCEKFKFLEEKETKIFSHHSSEWVISRIIVDAQT